MTYRVLWAVLLATGIAFLMNACASTPQASAGADAAAKEFTTHPGWASLYVYRDPFNRDPNDSVLYVDGRIIGATLPGTYFRIFVTPGKHRLNGIGPDAGSYTFEARSGDLYFVDLVVLSGTSRFRAVPPAEGRTALGRCCVLLESWSPGQRPLLR